jgi:hypothetical protein
LHGVEDLFPAGSERSLEHPKAPYEIAVALRAIAPMRLKLSTQVLVEPLQRVLPRLLCSGFVVTGSRVVVETVIGSLIDMALVRHLGFR